MLITVETRWVIENPLLLYPLCLKSAIIKIRFRYVVTFPVVGPTPLLSLLSNKSQSCSCNPPSSMEPLCFTKPITLFSDGLRNGQMVYLANERWGEVSWRISGGKMFPCCYTVTYRHSSAKFCCMCMWPQEPQQPFCDHEGVGQRQNQYAEGCREGRSKQHWSLRMSPSYWNNHPETAWRQESLSEKTTHLPLKTVQPGFPVTHS